MGGQVNGAEILSGDSGPGSDRAPRPENLRATSGRAGSGTTLSVARSVCEVTEALSESERDNLAAHEATISTGMAAFRLVGGAHAAIRDGRLYRETHPTFEAYVAERWGLSRSHSYRKIDAAIVVESITEVSPIGDTVQRESQARELVGLEPATAVEVVKKVVENDMKLTAANLRQARAEITEARPAERRRPLPDAFSENVEKIRKDVERLERHMLDDDRFAGHAGLLASRHWGDLDRTCALLDGLCEKLKRLRQQERAK